MLPTFLYKLYVLNDFFKQIKDCSSKFAIVTNYNKLPIDTSQLVVGAYVMVAGYVMKCGFNQQDVVARLKAWKIIFPTDHCLLSKGKFWECEVYDSQDIIVKCLK